MKMEMAYPGVTLVSSKPSGLSANSKNGWYDEDMINEIVTKTGKNETGYQLRAANTRLMSFLERKKDSQD